MATRSAWREYLPRARWFAGKGLAAELVGIEPLPWYTGPGEWPAVRSEIARVRYPEGREESYQLLVGYVPAGEAPADLRVGSTRLAGRGSVDFFDAPRHPPAMAALVTALRANRCAGMRWLNPEAVDPGAPIRLFTGEQSNTTVMIGQSTLLKLFRKLEPGRNLDAEVLAALTGSGITPDLYGVLATPAGDYDLAILCERINGVVDGWQFATDACAAGRDITRSCAALGAELRELHARLASAFGTRARQGTAVSATMRRRFSEAVTGVAELEQFDQAAGRIFGALDGHELATQRVHGDFHLGQVLHHQGADGPSEWVIIDFEGEPLKSLAERREFDAVWRDVAGALRSLDYARSAHPEPDGAAARAWSRQARDAFLAGYGGTGGIDPGILAAYEFDKAIYEVVYEARNRPDWTHIPWQAVQDEARGVTLHPPAS